MLLEDTTVTVGELVRERPARSRVFEALDIDYCCGGKLPLEQACKKKGLDVEDVRRRLAESDAAQEATDLVDADAMGLAELADHIQHVHHDYLKAELPRLDAITEKVARVHGENEPRLADVRHAFVKLRDELVPHMMKEEIVLFPLIRQLESHANESPNEPLEQFHCGSVQNPIRQMMIEHDHSGDELAVMREKTDGFTPPEWACNTYRAMLDALAALEKDMHQHIHKENNVLFIKAVELETQLTSSDK